MGTIIIKKWRSSSGRAEQWLRITLALILAISYFGFVHAVSAEGSTRIEGIAYFAEEGQCTETANGPDGQDPDFALYMTGDLEGCWYVFVESAECKPSGVYLETGTELYVGDGSTDNDGTFRTNYFFSSKYEDCNTLAVEIHGRCQHPIADGSGTGDYAGVRGRIDIKDDIAAGNFPYRGNLKFN